ncbi:MAG: FAD-dependent tricarballylate dehydrogenase TcuA [Chloroflexi bacterium]|nr:FAD-dependent tricarballylate dehydrogenase TcuA [Chloroflexota bacterium]
MPIFKGDVSNMNCDVLVVGGGISGLCAAITAREQGAEVILIEKAPIADRGGNSKFSTAEIRYPHSPDEYCGQNYTEDDYRKDFMRLSQGRASPELVEAVVKNAASTVEWLSYRGIEWQGGYQVSGYHRIPMAGGLGLVNTLCRIAEGVGVAFAYETPARHLIVNNKGAVIGCRAQASDEYLDIYARGGVVLATGGFQANVQMRVAHLGRFADSLILRGSRCDDGDGILMALDIGARPAGQWGDYNSAVVDARSPKEECGATGIWNFNLGIIVDRNGKRFIDEGEDFADNTCVKVSKHIIDNAGGLAYFIFDSRVIGYPEFYRMWAPFRPPYRAESLEELSLMLGIPPEALAETVTTFNTAVQPGEFDPARLNGKHTEGITPPKSNWALPLDTPSFGAVPVTGGITFTFGGLQTNGTGQVINTAGKAIPGLYAAGELVGELYYYNYLSATSVIRGAVFGRIAGKHAAERAAGTG